MFLQVCVEWKQVDTCNNPINCYFLILLTFYSTLLGNYSSSLAQMVASIGLSAFQVCEKDHRTCVYRCYRAWGVFVKKKKRKGWLWLVKLVTACNFPGENCGWNLFTVVLPRLVYIKLKEHHISVCSCLSHLCWHISLATIVTYLCMSAQRRMVVKWLVFFLLFYTQTVKKKASKHSYPGSMQNIHAVWEHMHEGHPQDGRKWDFLPSLTGAGWN